MFSRIWYACKIYHSYKEDPTPRTSRLPCIAWVHLGTSNLWLPQTSAWSVRLLSRLWLDRLAQYIKMWQLVVVVVVRVCAIRLTTRRQSIHWHPNCVHRAHRNNEIIRDLPGYWQVPCCVAGGVRLWRSGWLGKWEWRGVVNQSDVMRCIYPDTYAVFNNTKYITRRFPDPSDHSHCSGGVCLCLSSDRYLHSCRLIAIWIVLVSCHLWPPRASAVYSSKNDLDCEELEGYYKFNIHKLNNAPKFMIPTMCRISSASVEDSDSTTTAVDQVRQSRNSLPHLPRLGFQLVTSCFSRA